MGNHCVQLEALGVGRWRDLIAARQNGAVSKDMKEMAKQGPFRGKDLNKYPTKDNQKMYIWLPEN